MMGTRQQQSLKCLSTTDDGLLIFSKCRFQHFYWGRVFFSLVKSVFFIGEKVFFSSGVFSLEKSVSCSS